MRYRVFVLLTLIVATLAVFWPAHDYGFVSWDDSFHVYESTYGEIQAIRSNKKE